MDACQLSFLASFREHVRLGVQAKHGLYALREGGRQLACSAAKIDRQICVSKPRPSTIWSTVCMG